MSDSVLHKVTPMTRQYLEIKSQHENAILFYRMGDFYEMFYDDAVTAARVLGITLTSRSNKDKDAGDKVPMCGVPYHAVSAYLAKLVKAGFRVAICEQTEDPSQVKSGQIVRREVVRVVTPGLTTEEQLLDDKSNRYLAAVCMAAARKNAAWSEQAGNWGLSLIDITTGEFLVTEQDSFETVADELARLAPSELLFDESDPETSRFLRESIGPLLPGLCLTERPGHVFYPETARDTLQAHFRTVNLAGFGCDHLPAGLAAAGALLQYIQETQKTDLSHIEKLTPLELDNVLLVDDASRRNLELVQTIVGGRREGSLLATLDYTCTPMGARLLRKRLLFPLRDEARINRRLAAVHTLYGDPGLRQALRDQLGEVYDLERLNSRVVLGSANGRDLLAMQHSLARLPLLRELLAPTVDPLLREIHASLDVLPEVHALLARSIREDAGITLREGKLIKEGFNAALDELLLILRDGRKLILELESRERQRTGINNLKVGFNKVFGYFLEVSRGQLANVPDYFIRKQTLVNAERFITPELKEFENKVMGAQERQLELEYRLFGEIRQQVATESAAILQTAAQLARLDYYSCLAEAAVRNHYVRPQVNDGEAITISEGRHPVIEQALPAGRFVPNDVRLDQHSEEVLIITGPNMAGKSTVLRQTALIVLMAQMGSFVPADQAEIGMVDRIFTRVGAMDDLRRGQSTFMVEMNETANILNNATEKSLVILDEIGRGTSTFDGLSIAWAVAEDLVTRNGKGVKTLFATHYHELTELALTHSRVKNYNIAVREWNDSIIFLHKLMKGSTNRSYGIQVAALAGVPPRVVTRASEILRNIENGEFDRQGAPRIAASRGTGQGGRLRPEGKPSQLSLFAGVDDAIKQRLRETQLDSLSPLAALSLLYELKEM
ncbi:MAG: DNA mismatch repair protein MutS [Deltaproteobacteria bacterium RIFOXYD12_FULL_57_12]|nr:MAG: DNA mismatch repair protein MutS [Deltaproteobacteria bacterium RIFOXYD12_FULL_57_12]